MNECCAAGQEARGNSAALVFVFVFFVFLYQHLNTYARDCDALLTMRACSRPMEMTVLLMIPSRDTTMSWMCLKVFPCEKREGDGEVREKGRARDGQALLNFQEWNRSADIVASGFHPARRGAIVLQSPPVQPFIINVTNGELGDTALQLLQASRHQTWTVSAECSNFTVCPYDVFTSKSRFLSGPDRRTDQMRHAATVRWKQTLTHRRSSSGLVSTAVLCSQAVQRIFFTF